MKLNLIFPAKILFIIIFILELKVLYGVLELLYFTAAKNTF